MIASKILSAVLVASICSCALGAGIYRAETKGGSHLDEKSSYASPAQVGARKSADLTRSETPKIEQLKTSERLEQFKQESQIQLKEEYPPLEQAPLKQEEYREEPAAGVKSAAPAAPIKGERKSSPSLIGATKQRTEQVRFIAEEQRKEEPKREEQREFKQEKIDSFEQKRYAQQQELDSEPVYQSRYEEQIQQQEEQVRDSYAAEGVKGGARKIPTPSFVGLEQVKQEQEQEPQLPIGEPEPYQFSYQVDGSSRSEQGDTKGVVRGQYTLQGADGASRVVDYVADHNGFRATVNTNEFGTESKSPANINLRTSQPLAEEIAIRMDSSRQASLRPLRLEATKSSGPRREEAVRYESAKGYAQEPLKEAIVYPAKGQQLAELRAHELPQQQEQLRSDDLLDQPQQPPRFANKQPQARASFESATAHSYERRSPVAPVASRARILNVRPQQIVL